MGALENYVKDIYEGVMSRLLRIVAFSVAFLPTAFYLDSPVGAFQARRTTGPTFAPDALVVLEGAQEVRHTNDYDGRVTYVLPDPFPAEKTIAAINRRLKDGGWVQTTDPLNPNDNSKVHDWAVVDVQNGTFFTWTGFWNDKDGNIASFNLKYLVATQGNNLRPNGPLQMTVVLFSKTTAETLRKAVRRNQPEL